jgi:cell division protein FtsW
MAQSVRAAVWRPAASEQAAWLTFITFALMAAGLIMVETAGYPRSSIPVGFVDAFRYFKRQLVAAALASGVLLWVSRWRSQRSLQALGVGLYAVFLVLMVMAAARGPLYQGNRAWIFGFQPSELAKVGFLIWAAYLLGKRPPKHLGQREVVLCLLLAGLLGGVLVWQRDLGMLAVFGLSLLLLLLLAGLSWPAWSGLAALAVAGGAVIFLASPMHRTRILAMCKPDAYLDGPGWHIKHCLLAIARGAGAGLGLTQSPDKWLGLPYPHSDSIFCVLAAETGLCGVALLLVSFGAIAWLSYVAAERASSPTDRLLAQGCGTLVCLQAALNLMVATNLAPMIGLTLPFVSYGGSSLIANALAMAVVIGVLRRGQPVELQPELS